jgi:hypothetical protein
VDEPIYVEPGNEFGDLHKNTRRADWQTPKGKWQKRILRAVNRKYYKAKAVGGREEQSVCNQIARQAVPMEVSIEGWPEEWVEFCCKWAEKKWASKQYISLWALLNFIMDHDKKSNWLAKKPKVDLTPKSADEWRFYDKDTTG